jgi:soluble P-type ATPase
MPASQMRQHVQHGEARAATQHGEGRTAMQAQALALALAQSHQDSVEAEVSLVPGPAAPEPPVLSPPASEGGPMPSDQTSQHSTEGLEGQPPASTSVGVASGARTPEKPFAPFVSFQSFRQLSAADWSRANAFTRIATIAAVCNKASFAGTDVCGTTTLPLLPFLPPSHPSVPAADSQRNAPAERAVFDLHRHYEARSTLASPAGEAEGGTTGGGSTVDSQAQPHLQRQHMPAQPLSLSQLTLTHLSNSQTQGLRSLRARGQGTISRFESFLSRRVPAGDRAPASRGADTRAVHGDASEAALLRWVDGLAPISVWRHAYPLLFEVPFNSDTKVALCVTRVPEDRTGRTHIVFMKGAPERVVDRCTHRFHHGREVEIDADFRMGYERAYERFGVMGERVLGFAYCVFEAPSPDLAVSAAAYAAEGGADRLVPQRGLVFAGLVSLVDPPKAGVAEAVAACRGASIKVSMVTGDHPLTAEAIARKVNIITLPTAREVAHASGVAEADIELSDERVRAVVMPGYALKSLSVADWDVLLSKEEVVFARTSPTQKLEIVEHYQRLKHVVCVTGDGTNDAPALKKANIGVAMGSAAASDVAREAADVVLLDDNFASIVGAIATGRSVFDNIKKSLAYTLTHQLPELVPVFCLLTFDIPLMLPGLVLLTIDVITEQGPATSLAFEPPEASVMLRPPRDMQRDRLIDLPLAIYVYCIMGAAETLVCILAFMIVFSYHGVPLSLVAHHRELWIAGSPTVELPDGSALTGAQQQRIYFMGAGAYYIALVLAQACMHIFMVKTRLTSAFVHRVFANHFTLYGSAAAVFIMAFCIYVPVVNSFFNVAPVYGFWWCTPLIFGAFALAYTECTKLAARRDPRPDSFVKRWLIW